MNAELKAKWVAALRSGDYKQGIGGLRDTHDSFCCLGVLCDIVDPGGWQDPVMSGADWVTHRGAQGFPDSLLEDVGVDRFFSRRLAKKNDGGITFDKIADLIEGALL